MSQLNNLITKLCPSGVEQKKIKEVFRRLKGTSITAAKMKEIAKADGEIRIFAGGKTVINANEEDIPNANITRVPAVLVQSRGVIDVVYYESPFTFKNEMWAYTSDEKISVKFLYYILKNNIQQFRDAASGMGALPQISLPVTENFLIPVPPLPVQAEIVHILDNFTELIAELTAELMARKRQYKYFRDMFFSFTDDKHDVQIVPLKNVIVSLTTGLNPRQNFKLNEQNATCFYITGKDIFNNTIRISEKTDKISGNTISLINKRANLQDNNLLFVSTGTGTVGRMTVIDKYDGTWSVSETIYCIKTTDKINPRYLMHFLYSTNARQQFEPKISKGSVPHLKTSDLLNVRIPILSLEIQQRIVNILDNFDTICFDLKVGLPAEIEARQKQYEYYRDKLLTFNLKEKMT